jgi:hypothetical protein
VLLALGATAFWAIRRRRRGQQYWDTRVELDRCLFNSSQDKTDTYIIGGFLPHLAVPRFLTQPVGGFINNILRGLLRINYELSTKYYINSAHSAPAQKYLFPLLDKCALKLSHFNLWRFSRKGSGSTQSFWSKRNAAYSYLFLSAEPSFQLGRQLQRCFYTEAETMLNSFF